MPLSLIMPLSNSSSFRPFIVFVSVIANKNYFKLLSNGISLKDLTNYPLILQAPNSNSRCFLEDLGNKYKVSFSPTMEIASHSVIVELVKTDFGIGFEIKHCETLRFLKILFDFL